MKRPPFPRPVGVAIIPIAASLILLTAYYGESSDGRLHAIQRGALGALSPIQEGASRVFKPVRDLFGWFGDTLDAKDQRDQAIKERDRLRNQLQVLMQWTWAYITYERNVRVLSPDPDAAGSRAPALAATEHTTQMS